MGIVLFGPAIALEGVKFTADFICFPYISGYLSGLKSHALISHDYLSPAIVRFY